MFKTFLGFLTALFISVTPFAYSAVKSKELPLVQCTPQLRKYMDKIEQLPEAKELLNRIQKEGKIFVKFDSGDYLSQRFGAFWDPDSRTIFVAYSNPVSAGDVIGSIIFELHNALMNSHLERLHSLAVMRKINKENYVRGIEKIEYENSLKAATLAEKGIKEGLFPANARLPTYKNFEEHYRMQKIGGHSAWIASIYDNLSA